MASSVHPDEPHAAGAAAPNLVLLPSAASLDASDVRVHAGELNILGLGLVQRTVLAARRAGYGQIFFLGPDRAAPPGITAIADWRRLADTLIPSQKASLVIAPATILSETDWLERLAATQIEPAAWAAIIQRIVVLA